MYDRPHPSDRFYLLGILGCILAIILAFTFGLALLGRPEGTPNEASECAPACRALEASEATWSWREGECSCAWIFDYPEDPE